MTTMAGYKPGTFCWVDLATTDADGAKAFYGTLFGWEVVDIPIGDEDFYSMLKQNDRKVCALYKMRPEMMEHGVPPHWDSYVSVESADEAASKVADLGGSVVMEPFDVMEDGRMAVVQDPAGATFSVWQPKESFGAELVNEPNSLCWNELFTNDLNAGSAFYTGVFGWSPETMEMPTGDYVIFKNSDQNNAGMMAIQEEWGDVPPHWSVYFAVKDCDATIEQAQKLGADAISGPTEMGVGKFATLQDPQGAHFSVIRLADPD